MSKILTEDRLDSWIKTKKNVLLEGKHGVGKTAIIKAAFDRNFGAGKWAYFSAATMDPWVDFIGIPRQVEDEKGEPFLDLIKPRQFRDDQIEAIFIDEFNRAHKKVKNALMELIQFGSINGKAFPNLKVIWAAINPKEDDDSNDLGYHVDEMDPAQEDRFHIKVQLPYEVDREYFTGTYGSDKGNAACDWWFEQPEEVRQHISPRRLDYALQVHKEGGEIKDFVIPGKFQVDRLIKILRSGSPRQQADKLVREGNVSKLKSFISNQDNWASLTSTIVEDEAFAMSLLPFGRDENVASLISDKSTKATMQDLVLENAFMFEEILTHISQNDGSGVLRNKTNKALSTWNRKHESTPKDLLSSNITGTVPGKKDVIEKSKQLLDSLNLPVDLQSYERSTAAPSSGKLSSMISVLMNKLPATNTAQKKATILSALHVCSYYKLTSNQAWGIMEACEVFARKAQAISINKHREILNNMTKSCLAVITKEDKVKDNDIINNWPTLAVKLFSTNTSKSDICTDNSVDKSFF